ncbi:Transcription initiation factor TFIID subunit 8 [Linum perenne]
MVVAEANAEEGAGLGIWKRRELLGIWKRERGSWVGDLEEREGGGLAARRRRRRRAAIHHDGCLLKSGVLKDVKRFVNTVDEIPFAKPIPRAINRCEESGPGLAVVEARGKHIPDWLPAFPDKCTYMEETKGRDREKELELWGKLSVNGDGARTERELEDVRSLQLDFGDYQIRLFRLRFHPSSSGSFNSTTVESTGVQKLGQVSVGGAGVGFPNEESVNVGFPNFFFFFCRNSLQPNLQEHKQRKGRTFLSAAAKRDTTAPRKDKAMTNNNPMNQFCCQKGKDSLYTILVGAVTASGVDDRGLEGEEDDGFS